MAAISRQFNCSSCRLEITAQPSPLSRWAKRPILKSVDFLLSFQDLSGRHHEPLEIRGDQAQLQVLSETVSHYVQNVLGQSLTTSVFGVPWTTTLTPSDTPSIPGNEPQDWAARVEIDSPKILPEQSPQTTQMGSSPATMANQADAPTANPDSPYLYPRSLLTHNLVLGTLTTNTDDKAIPLKTSQLFDLVSALDNCAAELETLPLPMPTRRPALPIWASSAAAIVLMVGVTTATLQITQKAPPGNRDTVTTASHSQKTQPPVASAEVDSVTSAPSASPTPTDQSSSSAAKGSPQPTAAASATAPNSKAAKAETSSQQESPVSPSEAPPDSWFLASPSPSLVKPKQEEPSPSSQPSEQDQAIAMADQPTSAQETAKPSAPSAALPAAPPTAAEPSPTGASVDTESEKVSEQRDRRSPEMLNRQAPTTATHSYASALAPQVVAISQYIRQRWQVPVGLSQPLQYQLTLNPNGSLKQVQPLNLVATQYLPQVPLPAAHQPFIAPFQSAQPALVRLVLQPNGTVQTFVEAKANPKKN
ncbi:MAG: DUF4335 domain-containing protein [Acaryochloris sp. RU_4_1]|nr:DUF4335 domain-containing protein [Acaryochloris sp. RU_4_1]NJR55146.1 DUF4335 domain-containing protein [Acaryochloris sp. CRU_2_0]